MTTCPSWCEYQHLDTHTEGYDSVCHDGTPVKYHAHHFTSGDLAVWVTVSEFLTSAGLLFSPPVVEVPDIDYRELTPKQARMLAGLILVATDLCEAFQESGESA